MHKYLSLNQAHVTDKILYSFNDFTDIISSSDLKLLAWSIIEVNEKKKVYKHDVQLYKTLWYNKCTNFPPCRDNQTPSLSPSCLSASNTFALSSAAKTTHERERWSGGRPA